MIEEVVRLEPAGIGAKITLGECYEGAGKLASAVAAYERAEAAAAAAGQGERQRKAHDRAAAIKPRQGHLTVVVPPGIAGIPGLDVQRDGVSVGQAQWGLRLPADGGRHRVTAAASGKQPWDQVVVVTDGADTSVEVGPLRDPGAGGQLVAGIVVGSVGLAAIGVASAFGMMAIAQKNDSAAHSTGNTCDDMGFQHRTDGRTDGNVSTTLFVIGGVALAAGVTVAVTAPRRSGASARITFGPGSVAIGGTFR
jgi:hypothetical protein